MGLTRKKITVRRKGRTFQRSVMVRAEAIGKRTGGKRLNSLNPWEAHHVEGVSTDTRLGERQKAYGSSGPGSSHSWLAMMAGAAKQQRLAGLELHTSHSYNEGGGRSAGVHHAAARQVAGEQAV